MSYPEHPETIILKNKFYPKGLREIDIWNYYQKNKTLILNQTRNRELMFAVMVDINKPVLKRKAKNDYIKLTPKNYDTIISGRTITIYSTMQQYEDFGIIDIDTNIWNQAKWATHDTYTWVLDKFPIVRIVEMRYTGKEGFHIICNFPRKLKIDTIKFLLKKELQKSDLVKKYTIEVKRKPEIPNLDLSPNKFRGAFITHGSLSLWGLKCMDVGYNDILRFDPFKARI